MKIEVRKYREADFCALFAYWQRLGEMIPYFFPVTPSKWHECMFADQLGDQKKFNFLETFVAEENGQIIGFIQYGQPAFAWDQQGQKYPNPQIGIIRHFYFEADRLHPADLLFDQCESFMKQFSDQHAFYHIFGMSCNAHHGKLHESLAHVARFLRAKGYQVEHQNQYYSLALQKGDAHQNKLRIVPKLVSQPGLGEYAICLCERKIGMMQIRYLEELTGGATADIVYMMWIGIDKAFRRQGWGSKAMDLLLAVLYSQGYRQLHLDTASTNQAAQQFYEHYGFENRGRTRSFIKSTSG